MDEITINPLFSKIEDRAKEVGFKDITALCAASKASRGALTDLKYGRTKGLSVKTIEKLAPALNVSMEFFASGDVDIKKEKPTLPEEGELDPRRQEAWELLNSLSDEKFEKVLVILRAAAEM